MRAALSKAQIPDIAAQVTYAMRIMGIAPLPRNYELYYEAYIGSNPKLTKELAALGSQRHPGRTGRDRRSLLRPRAPRSRHRPGAHTIWQANSAIFSSF